MQKRQSDTLFFSGLSGLQIPIPKYLYPPPFQKASRLTYYSSLFNSIEFNSSFYKIPQARTVEKWAASVSEDFRFSFKLWKGITHSKGLNFNKEDVFAFFKAINSVKRKNACVLIQFPPSLSNNYSFQLEKLLSCVKEINTDWKIAVEFRNKSWHNENIYDLLGFYNTAIVIQDIPKSATPYLNHRSDFIYIRYHGPTGNYRGSYSEDSLNALADRFKEWMEEGKTVYVYFNNTMGEALENLKTLNSMLHENEV